MPPLGKATLAIERETVRDADPGEHDECPHHRAIEVADLGGILEGSDARADVAAGRQNVE
jgi:hypothetical protein